VSYGASHCRGTEQQNSVGKDCGQGIQEFREFPDRNLVPWWKTGYVPGKIRVFTQIPVEAKKRMAEFYREIQIVLDHFNGNST
jgi:hypothetical protein